MDEHQRIRRRHLALPAGLGTVLVVILAVALAVQGLPSDRTDLALMVGLGVAAVAGTGVGWTTHRLLRGQPRPLPMTGATGLESSTPHEVELAAADLAALADADPARRQELVNLLCARVRRPWSGEPDERALRAAILRQIRTRLLVGADPSWRDVVVDLSSARIPDGTDLSDIVVTGDGGLWLRGARFEEGTVRFDRAEFAGDSVSFSGATIAGATVVLDGATFAGRPTRVTGLTVTDGRLSLRGCRFPQGLATFDGSAWTTATVDLTGSEISGGILSLSHVHAVDSTVLMDDLIVSGGRIDVGATRLEGTAWSLRRSRVSSGVLSLPWTKLERSVVTFDDSVLTAAGSPSTRTRSGTAPPSPWTGSGWSPAVCSCTSPRGGRTPSPGTVHPSDGSATGRDRTPTNPSTPPERRT